MKKAIAAVVKGENLSREEASRAMKLILSGEATPAQEAAFLTALRIKSETLDEIIGCAKVLADKAEHIKPQKGNYIDFVGTGGDGTNTFNISTTSALVTAAAGVPVAKHGNRAVSSKSGSADVLEKLGVNIMMPPEKVQSSVDEIGIGFMFAQTFNKSMKYVSNVRRELGIRTIFNILGPLANPSGAKAQLIGVFSAALTEPYAQAMRVLGVEKALVVHGLDGMDEITTTTNTVISEIKNGHIINYELDPEKYGFEKPMLEQLTGGDAVQNALITEDILSGTKGARRDIVVFNSGAAIYIGGKAENIEEGIFKAEQAIDSGAAMNKLRELIEYSNK